MEERGSRVAELLKNSGSLRLVSIAEKPSFEEIKRGSELTKEYIQLDAVHINRIIREKYGENCEMCRMQRDSQKKYIQLIKETFEDKKIWISHNLINAPIGLNGLRTLASEIYGKKVSLQDIINPNLT
ncbi:MAG: hypothetical protein GF364_03500 [Candidatus Lokiarchaeota archaeon]|nr:hypothetical protein [Candidatus Lokiarchaeota archaeon]